MAHLAADRTNGRSVMRRFLESKTRFNWPADCRKKGQPYQFTKDYEPMNVLEWERRLAIFRKTTGAIIDQYHIVESMQATIGFTEAFAVKELVAPVLDENEINNEVHAMTDLMHPHVAALLATYMFRTRLHIVMFPAGCCDLGDLMLCISKQLKDEAYIPPEPKKDGEGRNVEIHRNYTWPLRLSLCEQLLILQRSLLCLCTAVTYLHESHLRHKDIKPENIIIDFSSNPVIMDFGISTKFEPTASNVTRNPGTPSTSRYRPPEMENGGFRDYHSDVWSLGCVFLEMVILLLGQDNDTCKIHCSPVTEDRAVVDDYRSTRTKN